MKTLNLKQAEEYAEVLFTLGEHEYSPTISRARYEWRQFVRLAYDNGMKIMVNGGNDE